jgi:hypothetical protein
MAHMERVPYVGRLATENTVTSKQQLGGSPWEAELFYGIGTRQCAVCWPEKQDGSEMPLYHLYVTKGQKKLDRKVIGLPNAESAKRHAERLANGLTVLSRGFGATHLADWHVQVTDEKGNTLARCDLAHTSPGRSDVQRRLRA